MDIALLSPMLFAKINNPCGKPLPSGAIQIMYLGVWRPVGVGSLETCCV